jgi:TRAP transporter TAXI family solute receptor
MPLQRIMISIMSATLVASLALPTGTPLAQQNDPGADAVRVSTGQNTTVSLIGGGPGSTDTRIAADIAEVLDDGDRLRVLPMLGRGSIQNIADLIYLKGVDVAIVHADALTQTMQRGSIPREASVQYIAKLFQEEIHVLARREIATLNDLNGRIVSIGPMGSGTELTASAVLEMAHITPNIMHESQSLALDRLRRGEIAAMFVVGGKPVPTLQAIEPGTGLHFLPIPLNAQLIDTYLPTSLDHQRYPNLVPPGPPVDTLAVSSILVTLSASADSQRAKRVNRFVDTLFERFDQFAQPGFHPKWQEVNLSAQVQGWTRYPEAQNFLKKDQPAETDLRTSFDAYLNQSGQKISGMNNERRETLFRDFLRWREQHSGP